MRSCGFTLLFFSAFATAWSVCPAQERIVPATEKTLPEETLTEKTLTEKTLPEKTLIEKALINDVEPKAPLNPTVEHLYAKFKEMLTGSRLRGRFTVADKPMDKLHEESYEIIKVEKQPEGDIWVITARIKYGDRDVTIPVPISVAWAGNTPVLTLDNLFLPGLGTFGTRVVLHEDKYAGTWQHDKVGGHMFGMIERATEENNPDSTEQNKPEESAKENTRENSQNN